MKTALLLGTNHPIQRGEKQKDSFKSYLVKLCFTYKVKAIAEEIDDKDRYVAEDLCDVHNIKYKIIEPTLSERLGLRIENINDVIREVMERYEISEWPDKPSADSLSPEAYKEYDTRTQTIFRKRESEWLRRINKLDIWPVLIICGADHYESFYKLLVASGINVVNKENKWGL